MTASDSTVPLFLLFFFFFLRQIIANDHVSIFKPPLLILSLCVFVLLRMLLEKSSADWLCFSVTVSEQAVTLQYGQPSGYIPLVVSFRTEGRIPPQRWTHLVLQVRSLEGSRSLTAA